ncbi:hypothetical protein [Haloarcula marina]|uniref:hypothetical protein n=1 Tax=Haloarcula marina TaxID=2961574 RepID=UPI0020B8A2AF|nr:hypothetical protein [Halomicroarcula marina]
MPPELICPDCGSEIEDSTDFGVGRRVHFVTVEGDGGVALDPDRTVTLWHCANCNLVVSVS